MKSPIVALLLTILATALAPAAANAQVPTPSVSGTTTDRTRTISFTRPITAVAASVELFDGNAAPVATYAVSTGASLTITLPDTDDTYWVRVGLTDAGGTTTNSAMTAVALIRGTGTDATNPGDVNDDDNGGSTTGSGEDDGIDDAPTSTTTVAQPQLTDPGQYGALLSSCYGSRLALTDARAIGRTASITGVTAYAPGTQVAVRDGSGATVATATVGATGRFTALAPLGKKTSSYTAAVGTTVSPALALTRAVVVDGVSISGNVAQLDGRVTKKGKLAVRGGRGAGACASGGKNLKTVGKVALNQRTGRFTIRVKLPKGSGLVALRVAGGVFAIR